MQLIDTHNTLFNLFWLLVSSKMPKKVIWELKHDIIVVLQEIQKVERIE